MDIAQLGLKVDTSDVKKARDDLGRFTKSADEAGRSADKFEGPARKFSGGLRTIAASAGALGAAVGVGAALSKALQDARQFSKGLAEVSTLIEGTPAQMNALAEASKSMAGSFGTTSTEQVNAFYQAISAGASTVEDAQRVLEQANKFAVGGVTDVTTGVDALTTAMNAYAASGLSAEEASDAMFVGIRAGKTTADELASALGKVVPIASSLGVEFDEVVGATAALTKQGVSTSEAVTGIRQALSGILKPTKEAADEAERLGLNFSAEALADQGLTAFLQDVSEKTGGSQESLSALFGSVEALNSVMALTSEEGGVALAQIMDDMEAKAGQTQAAYDKMADSMDNRLSVATSKMSAALLEVGEKVLPLLVPIVEAAADGIIFLVDQIEAGAGKIKAGWDALTAAFDAGGIEEALDLVVGYVEGLGSRLVQALKDAGRAALDAAKQIGVDIVAGIKLGISQQWQDLKGSVTGLTTGLIDNIKGLWETRSPSRVTMRIGSDIVEGLGVGIIDNAFYATDAIGQMVDYMFDGFKDGMKGIVNIFVSTLKQMAAAALKNKITIGLGIGATGAGGAAMAGQGGPLGSVSSLFGGGGFLGLGGGTGSIFGGAGLLGMGGGSGFLGLGAGSGLATTLGGGAFGAAASFAIPALAVGALLVGLFKKTEVLVANGVRARIEGASLELDSYEKTKQDNAFGMSSGFSRDFTRLDDAVQSAVGARLSATVDALGAFGLGTDLTGFSFSKRTEIKDGETFEGESEEVIREALDAAVAYLSDGALEMFQRAGEGLSDTLDRLVVSLNTVNPIVDMLGDNILPISLDGAAAASALADLAGGIEAFGNKAAFVYDSFLTDAEKLDIANGQLSAAFDTLNTALPETHAQFRDLMDAQDLSTEAGRQLYAALLDVAPLFVQVKGTAQEAADALQSVAGGLSNAAQAARQTFAPLGRITALDEMASITGDALRDAENALRAAFAAEQDRVSAAYADQIEAAEAMASAAREQAEAASQSAQERLQLRESIADALERAYRDRRVLDALGARNQINAGTAFLRAAVAAGGTSDLIGLRSALDAVADPATALFGSFAEYQQDFNVNTNLIEELKDLNAGQLSIEQRALRAAEDTVDAVSRGASSQVSAITSARDAQLSAMSQQMNALLGIDAGVMSVADAIGNLKAAQAAADAAKDAASGGITSQFAEGSRLYNAQNVAGSLEYEINQRYLAILGRNVDAAGLDFYAPLVQADNGFDLADMQIDLMRNKANDSGVPAFEGGGFTGYGSRSGGLDGRGGFMAMLHPNETVIDHTRQRSGGNGDVVAELRALREQNAELNDRIRRMQIEINRQGSTFRDWNTNGLPAERVS